MSRKRNGRTTGKLLVRRFIGTIIVTIILSFLPLFLIAVVSAFHPDPLETAPSAFDRLCEDPRDIYIQDYVDRGGGAAVVDKDLHVTELGGKRVFETDSLTVEQWADFLKDSEDFSYDYKLAYYGGEEPYWLVLRAPVSLRFVLSFNIDSDYPSSYPTVILLMVVFSIYFAVLILFAVLYSSKTSKELKAIEDEEEKKRMLLVSEISHDLKTPLASMQGYSEMLLQKDVDEDVRKDYLQMIYDNSVRTNEILGSLFMYSKLESAGYRIDPERTDICEFTRLLIASYITRFEDAGFGYEFSVPEEEVFVDVDRELLRRVFENLIENSMKYNDPGTKIFIGIEHGKDIRITVSDDGRGIPEEHRARIWEPFYRADQTSKGSGLGLAIVKQIVEMHGGKIVLLPEEGCKWRITLPQSKN